MDIISVASEPTEERDKVGETVEGEGDRLYDVLVALPFEERVAVIERMAERMGV